jgi:signal peptidase I
MDHKGYGSPITKALGVRPLENLENNELTQEQEEIRNLQTENTQQAESKSEMPSMEAVEVLDSQDNADDTSEFAFNEPVMSGDPSFEEIWNPEFFASIGLGEPEDEETAKPTENEGPAAEYADEPPIPEVPETAEMEDEPKKRKEPLSKSVLLYMHDLAFMLAGILVVFLLLFRVVVVSGNSMNNTLYNGDYLLLISNLFYREPQVGDVIVASKESFKDGAPIVKRVIAIEGQTVHIDFENGIVYVDGKAIDEPYSIGKTTHDEGTRFPLTVDEGCVFVLGDNRYDSKDSRHPDIGLIDKREIMGKVFLLFMPGEDVRGQRDFGRIGAIS